MSSVVFLRGVNVGRSNRCQPAVIAKHLTNFGVINIGAVGTFVVRTDVSQSVLRNAFARELPFQCEIMICPAADLINLASRDPFSGHPSGPDITRFVNILAKPFPHSRSSSHQSSKLKSASGRIRRGEHQTPQSFPLPFSLPSENDWLLKVIAIQDRFVLGLYRRQMKAISYLGKIERLLGIPATNRNWNTILKVAHILTQDRARLFQDL